MNKVIVTGGFGALGRAVGEALLAAGAQVALLDQAPAPSSLSAAALHCGGIDLCDPIATRSCIDEVAQQFGGLEGIVNVAGGFAWQTVEHGDVATWDRMYAMNVRTALLASQAALPHLLRQRRGRIVNIGAMAASRAQAGMGAYAAAKSGVARLTEAMAEEFLGSGITVNAILPGIIDTPANRAAMPDADPARWVAPAALARVVVFLLSDAAGAISGALLPVTAPLPAGR
ncbi:SDR family NAD(P)-dependent oxidoreductase [Pseudoduganella eburnea]|uniref:SDR family NAD(P)-dependent oxidoreductase n=1 Tax=Massilia eburnea TaxID=1776165 RepID=A0A6L6QJB5_9BURK|nr:SDR family NAD(P)-dependent oxidoreductase [Massilia eburnea]MTW12164.1 SDR family NAD(P)-dependent oxidoreductase [Massilia eburnea]